MTKSDAEKLLAKLFAAYPYHPDPLTVAVYCEYILPLRPDWMLETITALIRNEESLPSVARVLRAYKAVKDRRSLPEPEVEMTQEEKDYNLAQAQLLLDRLAVVQEMDP